MKMDNETKRKAIKLGKVLALTAITAFNIMVLMMYIEIMYVYIFKITNYSAGFSRYSDLPWTFHSLWIMAAVACGGWVAGKLGIKNLSVFYLWALLGFCYSVIPLVVLLISLPASFNILDANYYVMVSYPIRLIEGGYDDKGEYIPAMEYDVNLPFSVGDIYPRSIFRNIIKEDDFLGAVQSVVYKKDIHISFQGFLAWQTGVAMGYTPNFRTIPGYTGYKGGFWEWLSLFMQVGPVTVVELFIRGICYIFPILLLFQLVIYIKKGDNIWGLNETDTDNQPFSFFDLFPA